MFKEQNCGNCIHCDSYDPSLGGWKCKKLNIVSKNNKALTCDYFEFIIDNVKDDYTEIDWYDIKKLISKEYNTTPSCVKFWFDFNGVIHCRIFNLKNV